MSQQFKEQITFYGKGCERNALDRLSNLERCHRIVNAQLKSYYVEDSLGRQLRCRLIVRCER